MDFMFIIYQGDSFCERNRSFFHKKLTPQLSLTCKWELKKVSHAGLEWNEVEYTSAEFSFSGELFL